jgi:membrane-associated protease RseP (regulator of RpoE activity)
MMENITSQLGEFFGVKNGNGVLVRSVEKGSRAEKAGFRAGDIIVKVNDQAVHDTSDFSHAMKARTGNSVNVSVVRDKKEQNLNLTLPDRKESGGLIEEESLEEQENADDTTLQVGELGDELAKLRPQMELARQTARQYAEDARKSLCQQQKKLTQETAREREQFRKQEEKLRIQLRQMRHDMGKALADI